MRMPLIAISSGENTASSRMLEYSIGNRPIVFRFTILPAVDGLSRSERAADKYGLDLEVVADVERPLPLGQRQSSCRQTQSLRRVGSGISQVSTVYRRQWSLKRDPISVGDDTSKS